MGGGFKKENLVYKNLPEEFDQIPQNKLISYVSGIVTKEDLIILKRWEEHFKALGTPFAITWKPTKTFLGKEYKLWIQAKV